MSDIQTPTLLNNASQFSSVANNNCDAVESPMLGCVNVNLDVLNAAALIDSNTIEKVHTDNTRFGEIINTESFDHSIIMPSNSLNTFLNSNSPHGNFGNLNGRICVPETTLKPEMNGSIGKSFNLNTGR